MNQEKQPRDYLIIGGGPAGLQLGHYLKKSGHDYLILEAGERPGTFFEKFPRHRKLISINKVHTGYDDPETNLRWDWNSLLSDDPDLLFRNYSREYFPDADALVRYLADFAEREDIAIHCGRRVTRVSKNGHFQAVCDNGETYSARRLIVASGMFKPRFTDIPGIELAESYVDVSVDPEDFANQKVLVIGKGNSGFETADNLVGTTALLHVLSPNSLKLAWKTHFVGHLRAVNNNFLDTYQLKSQNAVLDATIRSIERCEDGRFRVDVTYSHADEESEGLIYDRIIDCTGFRFDASIFDDSCRPELCIEDRLPAQTASWESTNVEDLYFAGVVMQMRDFKKTTSGFIHGFRYNIRALHRILERKFHGGEWPSVAIGSSTEALTEVIFERINRTSALWQQFGFLGDLIVVSEDGEGARYYEELPVDYLREADFLHDHEHYVITLEFGKVVGDPFHIERHPDPAKAEDSTFLHPVIRYYHGQEMVSEIHLLENLLGEWWDEELHMAPLRDFLAVASRSVMAAAV